MQWHELKMDGKGIRDLEAAFASFKKPAHTTVPRAKSKEQSIPGTHEVSLQRRRDRELDQELRRLLNEEKAAKLRQRRLAVARGLDKVCDEAGLQ